MEKAGVGRKVPSSAGEQHLESMGLRCLFRKLSLGACGGGALLPRTGLGLPIRVSWEIMRSVQEEIS